MDKQPTNNEDKETEEEQEESNTEPLLQSFHCCECNHILRDLLGFERGIIVARCDSCGTINGLTLIGSLG